MAFALTSADGYTLEVLRPTLKPAAPNRFRFRIVGPDGRAVTEYRLRHERPLHLILVSGDLGVFRHVHPTLGKDANWRVSLDPLPSGPYRVFADFAPVGGPDLVLVHDVLVSGESHPQPLPPKRTTAAVNGYTVRLGVSPRASGMGEVVFAVRHGRRPVDDLEPYLGALGHLVAIRASDLAYLHVHPEEGEDKPGEVRFGIHVPSVGTYRYFFQFSHRGTIRTAAFTVEVARSNGGHGGH